MVPGTPERARGRVERARPASVPGLEAVEGRHARGGESDLDGPLDPVDAVGVRDAETGRDTCADEGRDDTDGDRPQETNTLPTRQDTPPQRAERLLVAGRTRLQVAEEKAGWERLWPGLGSRWG